MTIAQEGLSGYASSTIRSTEILAEGLPKVLGVANDVNSGFRAAILSGGNALATPFKSASSALKIAVGVTQAPAANKTPDNDQPKSGILILRCFRGVFRPSLITNKP
jgi:hypothetical protein